jgi:hypothetical protein
MRELKIQSNEPPWLRNADVLLPKDIPPVRFPCPVPVFQRNGSDSSVENAIESLFNAATTNLN